MRNGQPEDDSVRRIPDTLRKDRSRRPLNSADRRERHILLIFILIAAVSVAVWAGVVGAKIGFSARARRTNPKQASTARVYDYADMLTDKQTKALEAKIAEAEQAIHADIVIVIINESLEEKYPDLHYYRWDETDAYTGIRRYAESFWDENGFGWNKPGDVGNGIIMVDNIYRESNGYVYNWVAGSGDLRYSVGNTACQKLSQSFTDRLPMGDMPQYSGTYANALMEFVADCVRTGGKIHKVLSWSAFTPSGIMAAMTSGIIAFLAGTVIFSILIGRMLWQMNYSGKQRKGKKKKEGQGRFFVEYILINAVYLLFLNIMPRLAADLLIFVIFIATFFLIPIKLDKAKEEKSKDPFRAKEPIEPDEFTITDRKDRYVESYFVRNSSGGHGGSSGGGGHFGGGGHSGGGSHR